MSENTHPRLGLAIGTGDLGLTAELELTRQAEALEYDSVWIAEAWGRGAFTRLGALAAQTHRIGLGTAIVNIFSRSAALLAQEAATVDELTQGRFILGLGSSGPNVITGWHGIPYEKPIHRTREVIEVIRLVLSGAPVYHEGPLIRLQQGIRLPFTPVRRDLPIFVASFGPKNVQMTGEVADGWIPIYVSPEHLPTLMAPLQEGMHAAGRSPQEITVAPLVSCAVGETSEELEQAKNAMRRQLAFYIGAMGDYYYHLIQRYGFATEADRIRELWQAKQHHQAAEAVSEELLNAVGVIGTPQQARQRLLRYFEAGVHLPILAPAQQLNPSLALKTIEALAPARF